MKVDLNLLKSLGGRSALNDLQFEEAVWQNSRWTFTLNDARGCFQDLSRNVLFNNEQIVRCWPWMANEVWRLQRTFAGQVVLKSQKPTDFSKTMIKVEKAANDLSQALKRAVVQSSLDQLTANCSQSADFADRLGSILLVDETLEENQFASPAKLIAITRLSIQLNALKEVSQHFTQSPRPAPSKARGTKFKGSHQLIIVLASIWSEVTGRQASAAMSVSIEDDDAPFVKFCRRVSQHARIKVDAEERAVELTGSIVRHALERISKA